MIGVVLYRVCLPEGDPRSDTKVLLESNVLSITENSSVNIYLYSAKLESVKIESKICLNSAPFDA